MSKKRTTAAKAVQTKSRRNASARPEAPESEPRSARISAPIRIAAKTAPPKGRGKTNGAGKKVGGTGGKLDAVAEYRHGEATRTNNPPAKIAAEGTVPLMGKIRYEYSPRLAPVLRFDPTGAPDALPELLQEAQRRALTAEETRLLSEALRNQEPWLEWASKREKRHFEVDPVALHIHERVSPQAILRVAARQDVERSLFADPEQSYNEAVQFYRHEVPWTNRLILGDSLQVMTSLARREDLAGKVQMIYMDPPYGIKFASNFQPEVGKRDVKEREQDLTREPEMVKAYRDTWHLGIHSYLSYLRDRLVIAKELLADSGSIFVQISDDNIHRVREILDEIFGASNFCSIITVWKTSSATSSLIATTSDYLVWYAKDVDRVKYHEQYIEKDPKDPSSGGAEYKFAVLTTGERKSSKSCSEEDLKTGLLFRPSPTTSQSGTDATRMPVELEGEPFSPGPGGWKTNAAGFKRLACAERLMPRDKSISYIRYLEDFKVVPVPNLWTDTRWGFDATEKRYVVETNPRVISRCILMTTDPGDLIFDPTCGSGTTAFVAEQLGRRWITTDTSRVAVAIARQRLLTSKFDFYRLKNDLQGIAGNFIYKTVPHIMLKSIAQNENLDPIFAKHEPILDAALADCNAALKRVTSTLRSVLAAKLLRKQKDEGRKSIADGDRRRWELPEPGKGWNHWQVPFDTDPDWPQALQDAVTAYRKAWRAKMDEVNACIAANAEQEELVDQPEIVRGVTRVSGPFTVEAVQPPEMSLSDPKTITDEAEAEFGGAPEELETFAPFTIRMVETRLDQEEQNLEAYLDQMLRYLKMDGVRFPNNKQMTFGRLEPVHDGSTIHAEGRWANGEKDPDPEGRANVAVIFGPQYGPVTAKQLERAIPYANRRGYEHLVVAGFSFDGAATAVISEDQHPRLRVHMAHIRPDVNPGMEGLLKEQPGSQLFSVFGLPRTSVEGPNAEGEYIVEMEGVDIYDPLKNLTLPTNADKVAAWFLDGDYDGRCFCITQAFFPDKSAWEKLSKALTGVVDPARFVALSGTRSLPFPPGKHKCVAVKVIDPRGNEVMTVNRLEASRGR
jgi:adenine-specific DNA-methyltransferase